jgi:hypothetical protein
LAEWFYEAGIGEDRAILVEDDAILEAAIELPDALRLGTICGARLTTILTSARRAIVTLSNGDEALLEPVPVGVTQGAALRVEIIRERVPEKGRAKLAKVRATDLPARAGAGLLDRLTASGQYVTRLRSTDPDRFEQAGWSELLEQASSGEIPFEGGALRMSLTPAMTLFDVDGNLDPARLAVAGAGAAGRAIRRLAIGGSIGIDLPTLAARPDRQAAAAALDAALPQPFERTAVNGFGFLQLVRRRECPSLAELLQFDPPGAAARALLRRAERTPGSGERLIQAAPAVVARLEAETVWLAELRRRIGVEVRLRAEAGLAISAGHVQSAHPR